MKVNSIVTSTSSIKGEHDHKNVKGHKETVGIWGFACIFRIFLGDFQSTILFKNCAPRKENGIFLFISNSDFYELISHDFLIILYVENARHKCDICAIFSVQYHEHF